MQIFSNLPLGSFFTPGAVCMQTAPVRSVARRHTFVEDADLRRIANAEDVAVDVDGVFELERANVGFGERGL